MKTNFAVNQYLALILNSILFGIAKCSGLERNRRPNHDTYKRSGENVN